MKKATTFLFGFILWSIALLLAVVVFPLVWLFFRNKFKSMDDEVDNLYKSC